MNDTTRVILQRELEYNQELVNDETELLVRAQLRLASHERWLREAARS